MIEFVFIKFRKIITAVIFIIIFCSLFFFTANLFCEEKRITFFFENQKQAAIIKTFGDDKYFALSDHFLTTKSKVRQSEPYLIFGTGKISFIFIAGSFFFEIITHFNHTFVAQMNLPVIEHSNNIFVPLNTFIQALNSIKFLECTTYKDRIVIRLIKPIFPEKAKPVSKVFDDSEIHSKQEKTKQLEVITSNISNQIPKFIQSSIDYFLLNPSHKKTSFMFIQKNRIKKDTTVKIPPKYYVLPPFLKEK